MSDNKNYYYLKLKDNFFDSDELKILEKMPNGYKYSNILLKLYLKSLKFGGALRLNEYIPYNFDMIAALTGHDIDTVRVAIKIFEDLKLIETLDNGTIYMLNIQSLIGKSSTEGDRKKLYRMKIEEEKKLLTSGTNDGQMSDECPPSGDKNPPEIDREIESEKDIELENRDREKDIKSSLEQIEQAYFNTFYRQMSVNYGQKILKILDKGKYTSLIIYAIELTQLRTKEQGKAKGFNYTLAIIESWINQGFKTVEDVKASEKLAENKSSSKKETFSNYGQRPDAVEAYKKLQEQQQSEMDSMEIDENSFANIGRKVKEG